MNIGELIVSMTADASGIEAGAKKAQENLASIGVGAVAAGNLVSDAVEKMAEWALHAATAILRWSRETAAAAEQTEILSMQLGIAADSLEGWTVSMARVGLNQGSLVVGMRTLSKEMIGLEQRNEKSIALWQRLGFSWEDATEGGKTTEGMIRQIADSFSRMPDGAEKSRLAIELFGRSGLNLIPILNQGSAGLDELRLKSIEFGNVLTEQQRGALTEFDDALDDIGTSLSGFTTQVGAAFAPGLTALARAMVATISGATAIFVGFADAGEKLTIRIAALATSIGLVAKQLFSFSVFSKEAWSSTIDQVSAVDKWAASEIAAVGAIGKTVSAQKEASASTQKYASNQAALGKAIVDSTRIEVSQREASAKAVARSQEELGKAIISTTQIELHQGELLGLSQKARGEAIVNATKIEVKQREEASKHIARSQEELGKAIIAQTKIEMHQNELVGESQKRRGEAIIAATKIEIAQRDAAQKSVAATQERIGRAIVEATQIEIHQNDLLGESQKRRGEAIVAATKIEVAQHEREAAAFATAQERKGQAIIAYTQILLRQEELVGASQRRLGEGIVATTKIEVEQRDRAAQAWVDSYLEREAASNAAAIAEVDAIRKNEAYQGAFIVRRTQREVEAAEKTTQAWVDAYLAEEAAGNARVLADIAAIEKNEQYQGQYIVNRLRDLNKLSAAYSEMAAKRAQAELDMLKATPAGLDPESMRAASMRVLDAQLAAQRLHAQTTISDARLLQGELEIIEMQGTTKRLQIAQQFPSFWQKQLQAIENSNAFSMATLINQFSGAMASWIVQGTSFKNFWTNMQITMVQFLINLVPQMVATWINAEIARAAATNATNSSIVASNAAAAAASGASWSASLSIVWGEIVLLGTAVRAFFVETIWPMIVQFATQVVAVLEAIATALGLTALFGNVWGVVAAGVLMAAVAGILAAVSVGAFAEGAIVTGPTLGLMGEAGSPEAAIPLNERGAAFMASMLGLGNGRMGQGTQQTIIVQLERREIARAVYDGLPDEVWVRTGLA